MTSIRPELPGVSEGVIIIRISLSVIIILGFVLAAAPVSAFISLPRVDFSANDTYGPAPLAAAFTDATTGSTAQSWFFGDETYEQDWTLVNGSSGWGKRYYHQSVVTPDGKIVLMGGIQYGTIGRFNDTWMSGDGGAHWQLMNRSCWDKFGGKGRTFFSAVALKDGTIVVMGGDIGWVANDVWNTTDYGAHWTPVTGAAEWPNRDSHTAVALPDDSIVLMGGSYFGLPLNDTWRSTDKGAHWSLVNASSGWSNRSYHASVAMPDGSIVLMGGLNADSVTYFNDTWRSTDNGAHWSLMNRSSGWEARAGHSAVAMPDGSIVLTGGTSAAGPIINDMWRSTDYGSTWSRLPNPEWFQVTYHSTVVLPNGSVVLTGGMGGGGDRNETWMFQPAGSETKNPVHTYTLPGSYKVSLQAYNSNGWNSTQKSGYITATGPGRIGVYRNSSHLFLLDSNGNGAWNGAATDRSYSFGSAGDIPVTGDWNHDGKSEIGVFRNTTHLFYLDNNSNGAWNGGTADRQINFGSSGDIPLSGDWNNDGTTEIGVFRNSTHQFYLDLNGNGVWNGAATDKLVNFGSSGDIPISGDWNNDGTTEIGVFRNATHQFYLDLNGNGVWNGAATDKLVNFGSSGDIPITGDWNNDGTTEIGAFRKSTHLFYLDYNGNGAWNGGSTDRLYNFGASTDTPISGRWG